MYSSFHEEQEGVQWELLEIQLECIFIIVIPDLMQNSFRCSDLQSLTTSERASERERETERERERARERERERERERKSERASE